MIPEVGISTVSWESVVLPDGSPEASETGWNDAELMLAWLKDNSETYNLDTDNIIMGRSRGSKLAGDLLIAKTRPSKGLYVSSPAWWGMETQNLDSYARSHWKFSSSKNLHIEKNPEQMTDINPSMDTPSRPIWRIGKWRSNGSVTFPRFPRKNLYYDIRLVYRSSVSNQMRHSENDFFIRGFALSAINLNQNRNSVFLPTHLFLRASTRKTQIVLYKEKICSLNKKIFFFFVL